MAKVLIVDDSKKFVGKAVDILKKAGHTVLQTDSFKDAIATVNDKKSKDIDVIVSEATVDDKNFNVLHASLERSAIKTPIVLVSEGDRRAVAAAYGQVTPPVTAFVQKDKYDAELLAAVTQAIQISQNPPQPSRPRSDR